MSVLQNWADTRAKAKETAEQDVKAELSAFLVANPGVKAIKWDQYAPSFNDGDPCYFSVNTVYFNIPGVNDKNAEDAEDGEEDDCGWTDTYSPDWYFSTHPEMTAEQKEIYLACNRFSDLLHSASDLLEMAFGESAAVKVTRDEITVECCEAEY